jgi:endonuclease G, mitochondrial
MMVHGRLIVCLSFVWLQLSDTAFARKPDVIGEVPLQSNYHASMGIPSANGQATDQVIVSKKQYVLNWNIAQRVPFWVGWSVSKRLLGDVERTNVFRQDPLLADYLGVDQAVHPKEYEGSCIDRGHQVASGDRTATIPDNQATFMMSNIAPQSAFLNRKSWVSLERFLRRLVLEQKKEVFIYSGGSGRPWGHIGVNSDILMYSKNFKIAIIRTIGKDGWSPDSMRLLITEFPNVTSQGTNPLADIDQACYDSKHTVRIDESNRTAYWRPYVTNLNNVEQHTGIDFEFLRHIPQLTPEEIDELISNEFLFTDTYSEVKGFLHDMVKRQIAPEWSL